MAREYTGKVIDLCENMVLDWETVARECMARMSEDEVEDMAVECEWCEPEEDE